MLSTSINCLCEGYGEQTQRHDEICPYSFCPRSVIRRAPGTIIQQTMIDARPEQHVLTLLHWFHCGGCGGTVHLVRGSVRFEMSALATGWELILVDGARSSAWEGLVGN